MREIAEKERLIAVKNFSTERPSRCAKRVACFQAQKGTEKYYTRLTH